MFIYNIETPILLLVFNRPELTKKVFDAIKLAEPNMLYVVADGARYEDEQIKCKQVREIVSNITWDCKLITLFRDENLGCGKSVSTGISWFFEQEEQGIILEDDCLPEQSFFAYCSAMLKYFNEDNTVGHISGSNFQDNHQRGDGSYYFSALTHVWGWAGWRRVWKGYDFEISTYPNLDIHFSNYPSHKPYATKWQQIFEKVYKGEIDTWDYQYAYHNLITGYKSVMPNSNLISNIGIGVEASHTIGSHPLMNDNINGINEIIHPTFSGVSVDADLYTQNKEFITVPIQEKGFLSRTWKKIKGNKNEK